MEEDLGSELTVGGGDSQPDGRASPSVEITGLVGLYDEWVKTQVAASRPPPRPAPPSRPPPPKFVAGVENVQTVSMRLLV